MDLKDIKAGGAALIITILTWFFNEQSKRADTLYKQKDSRYLELISVLKEFYTPTPDKETGEFELSETKVRSKKLAAEFAQQVHLCWLYCSAEVVRKAHAFLATLKQGGMGSRDEIEKAAGELMVAIRKDMDSNSFAKLFSMWGKPNTKLKPDDFRYLDAGMGDN